MATSATGKRSQRPTNFALPFTSEHLKQLAPPRPFQTRAGFSEKSNARPFSPAYSTTAVLGDEIPGLSDEHGVVVRTGLERSDFGPYRGREAVLPHNASLNDYEQRSQIHRPQSRDFFDLESSDVEPADGRNDDQRDTRHTATTTSNGNRQSHKSRQVSLERASLQLLRRRRSLGSGYISPYCGSASPTEHDKPIERPMQDLKYDDIANGPTGLGIAGAAFPQNLRSQLRYASATENKTDHCRAGQLEDVVGAPSNASSDENGADKDVLSTTHSATMEHPRISPVSVSQGPAINRELFERDSNCGKFGDLFGVDYNPRLIHVAATSARLASPGKVDEDCTKGCNTTPSLLTDDASVIFRPTRSPETPATNAGSEDISQTGVPPTPRIPYARAFDQAAPTPPVSRTDRILSSSPLRPQYAGLAQRNGPHYFQDSVSDHQLQFKTHGMSNSASEFVLANHVSGQAIQGDIEKGCETLYIPTRPLQAMILAKRDPSHSRLQTLQEWSLQPLALELTLRVRRRQISGRHLYEHIVIRTGSGGSLGPADATKVVCTQEGLSPMPMSMDDEVVSQQLRCVYYDTLLGSNGFARIWRRFFSLKTLKRVAVVPDCVSSACDPHQQLDSGFPTRAGRLSEHEILGHMLDPSLGRQRTVIINQLRRIASANTDVEKPRGLADEFVRLPLAIEIIEDWSVWRIFAAVVTALVAAIIATTAWILWGPDVSLVAGASAAGASQRVVGGVLIGIMVLGSSGGAILLWAFLSWATM